MGGYYIVRRSEAAKYNAGCVGALARVSERLGRRWGSQLCRSGGRGYSEGSPAS